jgi:hypothetical protein
LFPGRSSWLEIRSAREEINGKKAPIEPDSCFPESCASHLLGLEKLLFGGKMAEEKRAELYTSPGGKFIRADTLPRILAHWRSFRAPQKQTHFIKYDGESYVGEEVDKLHFPRSPT